MISIYVLITVQLPIVNYKEIISQVAHIPDVQCYMMQMIAFTTDVTGCYVRSLDTSSFFFRESLSLKRRTSFSYTRL